MPAKKAPKRVKAQPTNSVAERRWARAKGKGKPTHDAHGKFIKGNPGGGRPREPCGPLELEEFRAAVPDLLGVLLHKAVIERDNSMIRLALAYGLGTPVNRTETLTITAVAALPSEKLNRLLRLAEQAKHLAPGATLSVGAGEILDDVGIEIVPGVVTGEFIEEEGE
jgi:hypothetical protein